VLIPEENVKDLAEIPANVIAGLEIIPVAHVDQVLGHALTSLPAPIEWTEDDEHAAEPPVHSAPPGTEPAVRH
jgi:ATP-dependent Lon protease